MSPLVVTALLAQCFLLEDESPGWKQITLPPEAPQLAAPGGTEQFRSGDLAVVTLVTGDLLVASPGPRLGRSAFEFSLPAGAAGLSLRFARPLDGAKVDAVVDGYRGRQVLLDERRVGGRSLALPLASPDATRVVVTVHAHLREAPTLEAATAERHVIPSQAPEFPAQLRLANSLYVRSRGEPLELCQRPGQRLEVAAASLRDERVRSAPLTARAPRPGRGPDAH